MTRPASAGLGFVTKAICLAVAVFFAARAGVGLLAPDSYDTASQACELEIESPTERVELQEDILVFDSGFVEATTAFSSDLFLLFVMQETRSVNRPLALLLQPARGPPA